MLWGDEERVGTPALATTDLVSGCESTYVVVRPAPDVDVTFYVAAPDYSIMFDVDPGADRGPALARCGHECCAVRWCDNGT